MKHYLLNHQPQKELQAACAQQGQAPTYNARGKGRTSASPKTLTKVILVLLTMLLLPSAAWGQTTYQGGNYAPGTEGTGTWGDWNITSENVSSITQDNNSIAFSVNAGATGTITLSLTQTTNTSEKFCKATFSLWNQTGIDDNDKISLNSAQITNSDGTEIRNLKDEFSIGTTYQKFYAKTPEGGEGTKFVVTFQVNNTSQSATSHKIVSAEAITGTPYDLIVGGTTVTNVNKDNVTGIEVEGTAEVAFTPGSSPKLALNYVDLTDPIQLKNSMSSLTIDLKEPCSITTATGVAISSESDANITFTSTSSTGSLSLNRGDGTGLISSNITPIYDNGLTAIIVNPTTANTLADAQKAVIAIPYGITIAGVAVTNANVGANSKITGIDKIGEGEVKFTPAEGSNPAQLKLIGASISYYEGDVIVSTLTSPLEINLSGVCSITSGDYLPFKGAGDNANLIFTADLEDNIFPDELDLISNKTDFGSSSFYSDFSQVSYPEDQGGLIATEEENGGITTVIIREPESYNLTVAGVAVTSVNASDILGDRKVSFKKATDSPEGTLTLNGATISGNIVWNNDSYPLTIELNGKNSIICNQGNEPPVSVFVSETECSLYIAKADNAESATLKYASYGENQDSFSNVEDYFSNFNMIPSNDFNQEPFLIQEESQGNNYNYYYLTLTKDIYDLTVAGRQVHNIADEPGYKSNIFGDESVTFNDTEGVLTLNNAKIEATTNGIKTGLESLTIDLQGTNTITTTDGFPLYGIIPETGGEDRVVTLVSGSTPLGTLTLSSSGSLAEHVTVNSTVYNLESINWTTDKKALIAKDFTGLTIAGTPITSENIDEDGVISGISGITAGTVSYDAENSVLTMNGATINGQIKKESGNLTVHVIGNNVIKLGSPKFAFIGSGDLTFTQGEETECTLRFEDISSTDSIASGFNLNTSSIWTGQTHAENYDWMQSYNRTGDKWYYDLIKNNKYDLWLGSGTRYCDANLDPAGNTVFDPETSTLTYLYSDGYHVYSGRKSLTVKTGGNSKIAAITFGSPNGETISESSGTLAFAKYSDSSSEEQKFTLEGDGTNPVISGFTSVTYDDFTILSDGAKYDTDKKLLVDASGEAMTQAIFSTSVNLEKPSMSSVSAEVGEGVIVTFENRNDYGTLKYSINYVDGSTGVTDATYDSENKPTMSKPGTLTAYVYLNGVTSETSTGKYFGAKQEVFTVAIGDKIEGTSWFTPEIKADDQIESEFMTQEEDDSGIFEREGEDDYYYLVAKKSGTTTVNASLWCEEGLTVLNSNIALTFNVGESLSSVFEGENTYGAIYSETAIQVPEGMTAYVITGIDEETGSVKTSDPLDFIPAKTAVLLEKGTDAIAITHVPYTGTATAPTNNKLNYSDPNSPAKPSTTDNWYVLYNNKFVKVTTNTEVKGGKCYLNLNGTPAGTRGFYNIGNGEGTTAIREVKNGEVNSEKWGNGEWFDLQGRRLYTKPNKSGLYIHNGKKIVIK